MFAAVPSWQARVWGLAGAPGSPLVSPLLGPACAPACANGVSTATTGVPVNLSAPVVSGGAEVGLTLATSNGNWTQSPTSYAYQWQTSPNGSTGWTNLSGATSSTYAQQGTDAGNYLRSGASATNSFGTDAAGLVYSAAVGPIAAQLAITGTPASTGTVGSAYSFTPVITGGSGTQTVSVTGTLPPGASVNSSTGAITGTLTTAGTYSGLTMTVTDSFGATATLAASPFTITVSGGSGGSFSFPLAYMGY